MSRHHQHMFSRGIGWGTTTEHGRRVAAVHYDVPVVSRGGDVKPPPVAAPSRGAAPGDAPGARPMVAAFQVVETAATAPS